MPIKIDAVQRQGGNYVVKVNGVPTPPDRTYDDWHKAMAAATTLELANPSDTVTIENATVVEVMASGAAPAPEPTPTPVDCVMSEWSAWVPTSEWSECINGKQSRTEKRTRTIITPAANGGVACGPTQETQTVEQACTVPQPIPETGDFVLLADNQLTRYGTPDGPNWLFANQTLMYPWVKQGGDYLDKNGVLNGPDHHAVAPATSFSAHTITFNVASIVTRLLEKNTGFYLHATNGSPIHLARQNPAPKLVVNGVACPLKTAVWISPSDAYTLPKLGTEQNDLMLPALMRFDLSGVTGPVESATLEVLAYWMFGPLANIACNYLKMPSIVTDPANQGGVVTTGYASNLTYDEVRADSRTLFCPPNDSNANIRAAWSSVHPLPDPGHPTMNPVHEYVTGDGWDAWGVTALRMQLPPNAGTGILGWHKYITENFRADGPGPVLGTQERKELYFSYPLKIKRSVYSGMNEQGIKLSGLRGDHFRVPFDYRMEHRGPSPSNPFIYRFVGYFYDAATAVGNAGFGGLPVSDICMRDEKIYHVEQRVKLNTIYADRVATRDAAGNPKTYETESDGILEVWVDGVLVMSRYNYVINNTDPRFDGAVFGSAWNTFFHGGRASASGLCEWEVGPCIISDQRIGVPKKNLADNP